MANQENQEVVTLCATGDLSPVRNNPRAFEKGFALVAPILQKADIVFGQFEKVLPDMTKRLDTDYTRAIAYNGDELAKILVNTGYNLISTGSNHHMDAGHGCFIDTLNYLKQNNILLVGVGMNIFEARTPAIIERKGVRVAFLGYDSLLPRAEISHEAQVKKPGCAPMNVSTFYEQTDWNPGTPPKIITIANKDDLAAMAEDIRRAKGQADVVIMSIHWGLHNIPAELAMYEHEVGHAAIDAGADLVLGHHSHMIKGIQVYKGKVIFHCLGNFNCLTDGQKGLADRGRWESMSSAIHPKPEPGWEKYSGPPDHRKTMIAKCLISGKKITRVSFLPCMINQEAQPEPLSRNDKRSDDIYQYTDWCCKSQGLDTRFSREGDEVVVLT